MKLHVELTNEEVRQLILGAIENKLSGNADLKKEDVVIEVKTKQNYKAEWERGEFRVSYDGSI